MSVRDAGGARLPAGDGIVFGYAWYALQGLATPAHALLPRLRAVGFPLVETALYADREHRLRLQDAGLDLGAALTGVASPEQARRELDAAAAAGARYARCKLLSPHHEPHEVDACLAALAEAGERLDLPILVETHRDTATQDLAATAALLAAHPSLRLTLDVSHWRIGGDWPPAPRTAREAGLRALVLARVGSLHLRVSDGERIQVPLTAPHAEAIDAACATWREAIATWASRSPGAAMPIIVELLPPPYAQVDACGRETSDRWAESLALRARLADG